MQPTASSTPGGAELERQHAGGVREVPDGPRAGGVRPRRLAGEVGELGAAVVDERAHHDRHAVEPVEVLPHRATGRRGDPVDDVAVGREVAGGDREIAATRPQAEGGVHQLIEVHRGRVVDDHLAGARAEQRRQPVAHPLRQVDPVLPRADQPAAPLLGRHPPQPLERPPRQPAERVAVEVDERRIGDHELVAPTPQRIGGVERERPRAVGRAVCGAHRPRSMARRAMRSISSGASRRTQRPRRPRSERMARRFRRAMRGGWRGRSARRS